MGKYAGFQSVKMTRPRSSDFDLSHYKRSTTKMGRLMPSFITECIPGDSFRINQEILTRVAPLLSPIYDNMTLYTHFFFVPNRLLWEDWEEFITGGRLGVGVDPMTAPVPPFVDIGAMLTEDATIFNKSKLSDYLGVPIFTDFAEYSEPSDYGECPLQILPAVAYQRIWYDYYRDRNFVADDVLEFPVSSGLMNPAVAVDYFEIKTRNYLHDYFTSALPFTQRGEEVLMPLAGQGSVDYLQTSIITNTAGVPVNPGSFTELGTFGGSQPENLTQTGGGDLQLHNIDEVNFENSSVTINDFRTAVALQVWLERNAIAGSRYTESTQAHFGVRPQDSRLQRAEWIGGMKSQIKISEIVSTAYSNDGEDTIPLANLAGHGVSYGSGKRFRYYCFEHGFIIGITSIMNYPSYHQGLDPMWFRDTFLSYPWPTFANLGEQVVEKRELYASPNNLLQSVTFGYQSRYADWKYLCNKNHGDFHDTLLFWTMTREFADSPTLSEAFNLFDETTQERIFAVDQDADNFWLYIANNVHVRRALPYFSTPNTMGFGS